MHRLTLVLVVVAGCKDDGAGAATPAPAAPTRSLAGVYPEQWQCDSIATPGELGDLLGGTVTLIDVAANVQRGTPRPCSYEVRGREVERWSFDIDCRDGWKQHADTLFAQYKDSSGELVRHYAALADAGALKPSDAGVELRPPEPAVEVVVGAKGLDHHGHGLVFIDDDAPCYVRVVGRDRARRLALARLIAKNLTFANAPMVPRAAP